MRAASGRERVGDRLWDKVLDTIREYDMLAPGRVPSPGGRGGEPDRACVRDNPLVLVGVSGGPDSTVLLHVLAAMAPELGIRLHVAHLNHGFRGEEAARDADFVRRLAGVLGLPFRGGFADVPALAEREGLSAQDAARRARYRFFRAVGAEVGASLLALAHTLDDQAETVVMRFLRGAGSGGLSGIPPVRVEGDLVIIRPLLRTTREEIEAYCDRHSLAPRTDQSNLRPVYLRNRVRLELLPHLRRMEPQVARHLAQSAEILAGEDQLLDALAAQAMERVAGADHSLARATFLDLPLALQRRVLRKTYATVAAGDGGDLEADAGDLDFAHVENLRHAFSGPAGLTIQLPQGVCAVTEHDRMVFRRRETGAVASAASADWVRGLAVPGVTPVPELGVAIEARLATDFQEQAKAGLLKGAEVALECALDYNRIAMPLLVRTRRPGDRFQPLGMSGTKKLADFFIDEHVPREGRDRIPIVVTAGDELVWVGGHRLADKYRVSSATSTVLFLAITPMDSPDVPKASSSYRSHTNG